MTKELEAPFAADVDGVCRAAYTAFTASRFGSDRRVRVGMLRGVAAALEERRAEILATCAEETALTEAELTPEFERMTGTLRMFADLVEEGSWVRSAIDRPATARRA